MSQANPLRYAFLGAPYLGGVYTVGRSLRAALAPRNVEVRWVGVGPGAQAVLDDPAWAHEHQRGEAVPAGPDDAATGRALCEHLDRAGYDGVFVNVRMQPVLMNVVRYLPARIRRIMIVHSTQPGTYGPAASLRHHVHATVGVSPRIRDDLVRRYHFDPARTVSIFNGLDVSEFGEHPPREGAGGFRLLYLGRVEDRQKGVFWLPRIMERLSDLPVTLTIAGDGPDMGELRKRCRALGERVVFLGGISRERVPQILAEHDAMVMPSRWEGMGLSLVEAMAAGCVPVVSSLRGVTDAIVTDGEDGVLFPVGDIREAADQVRRLVGSSDRRHSITSAGRQRVRQCFSLDGMAQAYGGLIDRVENDAFAQTPLMIDAWAYPGSFSSPWRRMVPRPVKQWLLSRG